LKEIFHTSGRGYEFVRLARLQTRHESEQKWAKQARPSKAGLLSWQHLPKHGINSIIADSRFALFNGDINGEKNVSLEWVEWACCLLAMPGWH
jgi:hypothetical protein